MLDKKSLSLINVEFEKNNNKIDKENSKGEQFYDKILDKIDKATGIVFGTFIEKKNAKINLLKAINDNENLTDLEKAVITSNYKKVLKEYKNQNDIIQKAFNIFENPIDDNRIKSVDDTWIMNFMDYSKNICDDNLQLYWAKLLAGEFEQPGSVSLRTLDTVNKISKSEAETFSKVAKIIMTDYKYEKYFIVKKEELLRKYDICFDDIVILDEIGLIQDRMKLATQKSNRLGLIYNDFLIDMESTRHPVMDIEVYNVTKVGKEIFLMLQEKDKEKDKKYVEDFIDAYKGVANISYSEIIKIDSESID